ncbi:NAD/ferredoxin-dependent reductase-like protein [Saccharopolyspora erythraea NRRL 2338]|uniref:Ferredoxin reductase n=2 Tax=Saccharopolyspora erythraea TaxID=1836 RepID=A4FGY7_SACEN|nr:FAD-dependent oxidoreductase [Saccharopolyspora erythraea]EQD81784.1 ferredoxin reductase [Saccharopolyspora erythraea D]PFG97017.1 NAD/ferredoxin-dependent reductase-like protein [Saccharopolyspora erythraea NRRL 2338]QRK87226.1 FAD-dependent oxidoreductase [Saccharopolyspora erythraea]CAM03312.1 ferredoxin reductase [Saccharopolyspora erythraea NRRL 2338]
MAVPRRVVIVGAGLAGASAAGTLRERGFDGEILLFGRERHRPYELPALSKEILLGNADEPVWVHDENVYADRDIRLHSATAVERVSLAEHSVLDSGGEEHRYDRLLLATGSHPRALRVPGSELRGLHLLRTLDDSLALRAALRQAERVVVVGAGWIGCEVAAAARSHGAATTVIDPLPLPLRGALGDEMGEVFRALHAEQGVDWRLATAVAGFTGADHLSGVVLTDGTEIPADMAVVGVGAAPRLGLAEQAGLILTNEVPGGGVAVDSTLRTSDPDVFAAGDIAAPDHPVHGRIRVEHWANAKDQGTHVAGNLLGEGQPFRGEPYFFTDQYELGMEYRGLADPRHDELVVRGDLGAREFIAFWLREGRVQAAMNVNWWDDGDALQALVDHHAEVDARQLRSGDLASLVP